MTKSFNNARCKRKNISDEAVLSKEKFFSYIRIFKHDIGAKTINESK